MARKGFIGGSRLRARHGEHADPLPAGICVRRHRRGACPTSYFLTHPTPSPLYYCPVTVRSRATPDSLRPSTPNPFPQRSEEHTSELQSLMRISYAVFCLKKKKMTTPYNTTYSQ